jgi:Ca-activated chloride channel homolog
MIGLELTRPWMLLGLVVAFPIVIYYFRRSLSDFPWRQRLVSLVARSMIVLLLILAVAGLTLLHQTSEKYTIFVVDQSTSIGENAAKSATDFLKTATEKIKNNQIAFLPFAARSGAIQTVPIEYGERPTVLGRPKDKEAGDKKPDAADTREATTSPEIEPANDIRDGTNLASAIETAAGYLPPGYVPQILVLSDGVETAGDVIAVASRARAPISTFPLPARSEPEVQVSKVSVPAEVRQGEPFFVEVSVDSNHEDEAFIEVYRGDHKVIGEKRKLKVGENTFQFQQSIDRERLAAYSVRVSQLAHDTLLDNNMDTGLVFAAGKPRVLIVESDPNLIRDLAYSFEDEGIQTEVRPPQGMPETLADLQNYELILMSNVPATALSQRQMEVARTYVQELGGGFIMLGGEQSFGLGGYYKSVLEEILPIRSDFEKEKEKPSIGMVLVIDKSGSMSGDKIEMAKSAARSAVELLGRRDQVGVVAFDGDSYVICEMQSASNKTKISDEIARIDAGGGTTMYPAMEMANELLIATNAKLKHVIILTDGISSPGDFEGLTQQMVSSRITVSTVGVGEGADQEILETIARVGKGRYYFTSDAAQVPQIFARETVTASKSAIDEQPFLPQVVRATHALAGVDLQSAPFLLGYVMTRPKPTSEVILATEKGDPLLAWWRYGLGMTGAFTSDAKSRWAAEWITWPGFGKFWTQVVRQLMRKSDARGIAVDVSRHGASAELGMDAVDEFGQFLNDANVELTVIDPQLKQEKSALKQVAPGRYLANLATAKPGAYHMELAVKRNDQVLYRQSRGLTVGYSDELRIRPTNEKLLRSVAEISGGSYSPNPAELFKDDGRRAIRPTPLTTALLTLAALLLVLDVALRRIDFSLHWPFRPRAEM